MAAPSRCLQPCRPLSKRRKGPALGTWNVWARVSRTAIHLEDGCSERGVWTAERVHALLTLQFSTAEGPCYPSSAVLNGQLHPDSRAQSSPASEQPRFRAARVQGSPGSQKLSPQLRDVLRRSAAAAPNHARARRHPLACRRRKRRWLRHARRLNPAAHLLVPTLAAVGVADEDRWLAGRAGSQQRLPGTAQQRRSVVRVHAIDAHGGDRAAARGQAHAVAREALAVVGALRVAAAEADPGRQAIALSVEEAHDGLRLLAAQHGAAAAAAGRLKEGSLPPTHTQAS
mmetsp:Transcript_26819/g.79643  ORF Transcript_26819/g.79643 Transcript_26819/m.79643 type:complete len:286 (-) Transcript_26819:1009-1866(-)|eukprot:196849-Chlamydomonas_euryale.AAC.2